MPSYEMKCKDCEAVCEVMCRISEYDRMVKITVCDECHGHLERYFGTPPNFTIPGNSTYNGLTKVSGGSGKGQNAARVPINIFTEKPDGSVNVTRIGNKADINND